MIDRPRLSVGRSVALGVLAAAVCYGMLIVAYWGEGRPVEVSGDVPMPSGLAIAVGFGWLPALLWGVVAFAAALAVGRRRRRAGVTVGLALILLPAAVLPILDWRLHLGDTRSQRTARLRAELGDGGEPGQLATYLSERAQGPAPGYEALSTLTRPDYLDALRSRPLSPADERALVAWLRPHLEADRKLGPYPASLYRILVLDAMRSQPLPRLFERWPERQPLTFQTVMVYPEGVERLRGQLAADPGLRHLVREKAARWLAAGEEETVRIPWQRFEETFLEAGEVHWMFAPCSFIEPQVDRHLCLSGQLSRLRYGRQLAAGSPAQRAADRAVLEGVARELLTAADARWRESGQKTLEALASAAAATAAPQ